MTLDNGTDGQTDRRTDRVRRNMRPPPREEGRIISYASAKTCTGDDSTAQGNTKGWGHTNKLKQYKVTLEGG